MKSKKPTREQRVQFKRKRKEADQANALFFLYEAIRHPQTTADIEHRREAIEAYKGAAKAAFEVASWISFYEPVTTLRLRGLVFEADLSAYDAPTEKAFVEFERAMNGLSAHISSADYNRYCERFSWDFLSLAIHLNSVALFLELYSLSPSKHGSKDKVLVAFDRAVAVYGSKYKVLNAYGEENYPKEDREAAIEKLRNSLKSLRNRRK